MTCRSRARHNQLGARLGVNHVAFANTFRVDFSLIPRAKARNSCVQPHLGPAEIARTELAVSNRCVRASTGGTAARPL